MKITEVLRALLKDKDIGPATLAKRMNVTNQVVSNKLSRENIGIDKLNEMLRAMDYKLVIMPNDKRTPEGGYEVD